MSIFEGLELETDKPFRVLLSRPDGDPLKDESGTQAYIDVLSTDSEKCHATIRAQRERRKRGAKLDADDVAVETIAALTVGWYLVRLDKKALCGADGAPIPCNSENVSALYTNKKTAFIVDQVKAAVVGRENFMPGRAIS